MCGQTTMLTSPPLWQRQPAAAAQRLPHHGDRTEAEDLLQTALERAYRRWPSIRQKDVPEAYVRKIIVTAAIDSARRRTLRRAPLDEERIPGLPDPAVEGIPGRAALLSCVRELPAGSGPSSCSGTSMT